MTEIVGRQNMKSIQQGKDNYNAILAAEKAYDEAQVEIVEALRSTSEARMSASHHASMMASRTLERAHHVYRGGR
jgi:predicted S18 family serine protease